MSDRALRNAWQRHGLGLPPRPTTRQPAGRLAPAFVALNRDILPARARSDQELAMRVRRAEEYAVFGAEVVSEMGSETYGRRPAARAWAITRRAQRAHRRQTDRQHRGDRRQADRAGRTERPTEHARRSRSGRWWPMPADRPKLAGEDCGPAAHHHQHGWVWL